MNLPVTLRIPALGNLEVTGEMEVPDSLLAPGDKRIAVQLAEACALVGVSDDFLRREIKSGALYSRRAGARVVIPLDSLRAWLMGKKPLQALKGVR